jgi:predicted RNase H-like nuclease
VAGVDGCRTGWVVATWTDGSRDAALQLEVCGQFEEVVHRVLRGELALVAVDMPIGLADSGPRQCDRAARRLLGPRRSSVFPTPVRPVLACETYPEALEISRKASGVGLSKQAWFLVPKLREVDAVMRRVRLTDAVLEVSPELSFAALAGAPLVHPKRSAEGLRTRRELLRPLFPQLDDLLSRRYPGAAPDDLLDACALAWSAHRLQQGNGCRVGDELDGTGLPMTVSW